MAWREGTAAGVRACGADHCECPYGVLGECENDSHLRLDAPARQLPSRPQQPKDSTPHMSRSIACIKPTHPPGGPAP